MKFEKDFIFGVATAAYQIEGAYNLGGRTASIWDTFAKTKGKVLNMDNGDMACDHYKRYKEDVQLMKKLGVDSYRFSIAWPRIFPAKGEYNSDGMEFYKNLLIELKANGIKTSVTLYHWDLPQWAQDLGGWEVRESVEWFLEYAEKSFAELDDLVDSWITHNEPWCASILSNLIGEHAPGKKSVGAAIKVAHHLLLSHGMAVKSYRRSGYKKPIGITLNLTPTYSATESFEDRLAASNMDGQFNRWFLDPLFKRQYPNDIVNVYASRYADFSFIKEGDLEIISEPCDFLGINYYSRGIMEFDTKSIGLFTAAYSDYPKTGMGWDISPKEFVDLIKMVREKYTDLPIYITENGSAWEDTIVDGRVKDTERVDYLVKHLEAVREMNQLGLNVAGYYCWSLLDNFEWAFGYDRRFGIVHVDFETQKRTKKDSFFKYQEIIRENRE